MWTFQRGPHLIPGALRVSSGAPPCHFNEPCVSEQSYQPQGHTNKGVAFLSFSQLPSGDATRPAQSHQDMHVTLHDTLHRTFTLSKQLLLLNPDQRALLHPPWASRPALPPVRAARCVWLQALCPTQTHQGCHHHNPTPVPLYHTWAVLVASQTSMCATGSCPWLIYADLAPRYYPV